MMRVLCVDDALPVMEDTVAMCEKLPQITSVAGFTRPKEALEWMETHSVDLALLDIDMPEISGLMLAQQVKQKYPDAKIIFLTAFQQYAVEAIKLRASGYLLKPVSLEDLEEEVAYADSRKSERSSGHVVVKTFGNFEIFVDGETLSFHRQKAKELLAYLIDRNGRGVNRPGIFAALWEDGLYDHSRQKYLDVIIRSLRETLKEAGIEEILEIKSGFLRVRTELLDCDLYRFLKNEPEAVNAYRGEYMEEYSWAVFSSAYLSARK
ncbi:MAG: response regulator [Blautia sp.]|nr:response regulator [Blautia sp.]